MRQLNMYSAIKRYNALMGELGYEHNEIGTGFSDKTEGWNLRDMVAECDYILSTFYEDGHCNADMRTSSDEKERKMWRSWVGKLERFVASYQHYIKDLKCTQGHCSQYDNND